MENKVSVSIIIPTYNRAYCIASAIQSVINQSRKDWELIIVDDGSTDATKELVASFGDNRIKYFLQENGGAAKARNYGVSKAQADWIAYLDSDNELFPEYIETMFTWLEKFPKTVFAIPRAKRTLELYENGELIKNIDDSKDTPAGITLQDIFYKNFIIKIIFYFSF